MTQRTNSLLFSCLLAFGFAFAGCTSDEELDLTSNLVIENNSSFSFLQIYLSPVDAATWGADLLGNTDILSPGEVLEVSGIECDDYDVRIVDEDSDECIIDDIDLCLNNQTFAISDSILLACQF